MALDVLTSTYYMDRDAKHVEEKPYELKFPAPEGFPATNTSWSRFDGIHVKDIRGQEADFTIAKNGFMVSELKTSLAPTDFAESHKVEKVFLSEVAHHLKSTLKADRVLVFDYNLRISVPGFPISDGKPVEYQTPATIVHIDTTDAWTEHMHSLYKGSIPGIGQKPSYQYVNLWKPIKGPVKRWPLMLCDWNTYDVKKDIIARDLVYTDGQLETYVGMHNPKHQYHYLSDQLADEVWIMVQSDSVHGKGMYNLETSKLPLTTDRRCTAHSVPKSAHDGFRSRARKH
ncbi:hypothetical protein AMS68_003316 [Peltaster fructicola]|uniref:Uncharacterized protein n=1 Tax=Peltaster fructicola TaxID=286661 RepID=A0A6H0XT54_9PEZI|nr:hypothetical protein AMS68_003316 [Peltaster fructicola]